MALVTSCPTPWIISDATLSPQTLLDRSAHARLLRHTAFRTAVASRNERLGVRPLEIDC